MLSKCSLQIFLPFPGAAEDKVVLFLSAVREYNKRLRKEHGISENRDK
jgi:hypothetical protein